MNTSYVYLDGHKRRICANRRPASQWLPTTNRKTTTTRDLTNVKGEGKDKGDMGMHLSPTNEKK